MKIRHLSTGITPLIVLGPMAASLFFGSVAVGPHHEAAAASSDCAYVLTKATSCTPVRTASMSEVKRPISVPICVRLKKASGILSR